MSGPTAREGHPLDPGRLRLGLVVVVAIGAAVGALVAVVSGGSQLLAAIVKLPLSWLALALAITVASWFGQGVSFAALTTRGVRGQVRRMTAAFLGGDFPALVTPFGSGGIPGGIFALARVGLTAGEAGAVVAMHSLLTAVFFVIVGLVTAVVLPARLAGSGAVVWSGFGAILAALAVVGWVALRPHDSAALLSRVLSSRAMVRVLGTARVGRLCAAAGREAELFAAGVRTLTHERPAAMAISFAGLFFSRACVIAVLPVIMYGLGWRGDVLATLATGVGAMVLAVASPTPGGSGTVEAGMTALLATVAPVPVAGAATLLWRGITFYSEVVVGWVVFSRYLAQGER